jgi:hypothetical protein
VVSLTFPPDAPLPEPVRGRACVVLGAVHAGDVEEGMKALQPLREIGSPLADLSQPVPYRFVQSSFDALFPRGALRCYWKSQYLDELSDGAIEVFADTAQNRPAPLTVVNLWHMGGAIAATGPSESAFPERSAPFMMSIDGNWPDPAQDADAIGWVRSCWDALSAFGTRRSYLNFTGLADEPATTAVDSAYGDNLERLAAVKTAYDPSNFFRRNNNVSPAARA